MAWSFSLGRLFGSEIRVHVTFFLLLLWVGAAAWGTSGPAAALQSILFVLALFACVVAHEFGHALMARRYGIGTRDITLLPIGGLARLDRLPEEPGREIAVALAGPAVNVVIWLVLTYVFGAGTELAQLARIEDAAPSLLLQLALANLALVVFNLIPAFPMDGGRVLRALLAMRYPRPAATEIAARVGQTIAILLGFAGLYWGMPTLALIAAFVFFAGPAESSDVAMTEAARRLLARDAMITRFEALSPDDTLDAAAAALVATTQHEFPVVDGGGRLLGILTRTALLRGFAAGDRQARVDALMATGVPVVAAGLRLDQALDAMRRAEAPAVGVTGTGGQLVGYITPENLGELMLLQRGGRA